MLELNPILVIVGPVDGNRDCLAAQVAEIPAGAAKNRHIARYGERAMPYFAVSQLFHGAQCPPDATIEEVRVSVLASLRDVDVPPWMVLTDTDLCDPQSIELLLRTAEAGGIRLIATLTSETVTEQEQLVSAGRVIESPPLDSATLAELLRVRFGAAAHPAVTELLLERSGGSYAVVQDLADASYASGALIIVEGVLTINPIRQKPSSDRLTDLFGPHADLVQLTALLGQLDVDEALVAFGAEVVDLATNHDGLRVTQGTLVFSLQAEAVLVRRSTAQERQIELFERFASAIPRTTGRAGVAVLAADWWRATGRLLPVDLAGRAGREANLLGHYRRALVYTDPANNDEHAAVAPVERAFAFSELGDDEALLRVLTDLDPSSLSEDELYPYLRGINLLAADRDRDRLVALAISSDDPDVHRRREAVSTLADMVQQSFGTGDERLAIQLRSLAFSGQLTPGNHAVAFAALAAVLHHSGRPAQAVEAAEFAIGTLIAERDSVTAFHLDTAHEVHIMALVSALDVIGAERELTAYSAGVFASAGSGRITTAMQAYVAMVRGDMPESLASAHRCLSGLEDHDPNQVRGWVEALKAQGLVYTGRDDEARKALAAARRHPSRIPQTDLARRTHIASTYDALAEPEEALEILAEVVDEARRRNLLQAQIDAAAASVLIGGPPQVHVLLDAVDDLVDPSGAPLFWQMFARAARDYDIPTIVELADQLDALGARMFASGVAQFVLDMARRATDLERATRDRLSTLADLAAQQGRDRP
jgi:tetratricopeptide (TPR) repeat protein